MRRTAFIAAAALAVSGLTISTTQAASSASQPVIRGQIARLTRDAVTSDQMRRLITAFPAPDMQRLIRSDTFGQNYGAAMDTQIAQLSNAWTAKYGHSFSVARSIDALDDRFGSITMQSSTAAGRPAAVMDVRAAFGLPAMKLSLVCDEGTTWSVKVPSSLTADRLRHNLATELSDFQANSAHWPANEADAYRLISHRVLMAVRDVPAVAQATFHSTPAPTQASALTPHRWWQFWRGW